MDYVLTGIYKKQVFYNADNSYHVAKVIVKDSNIPQYEQFLNIDGTITVIGYFPELIIDEIYRFVGNIVNNNYGTQFDVKDFELVQEKDEESLIKFLSSSLFKGIGKKTATKIVDILGTDCIDKIVNDMTVLDLVPGLNDQKKTLIYEVLQQNYQSQKIMHFLLKNGFGTRLATKIYKCYKENTLIYLQENPYRLIDEIENIGFKKADNLAINLNFDLKSPFRIQAAIRYVFEEYCFNEGYTYLTLDQLLPKVVAFLNNHDITITEAEITDNINNLIKESKILIEENRCYLPLLYYAEVSIAEKLANLLEEEENEVCDEEVIQVINEVEKELNITYSETQFKAIEMALTKKVVVLTGGPGTGKTTIVKGFLRAYRKLFGKKSIALVAPTGRAAKRLNETTNYPAQTIHRLLGYQLSGEFTFNEHNPLDCDVIVIDEASMIDVVLMSQLLKSLRNHVKMIIVGDVDQLPSVGPGNVLKDIIMSGVVPIIKLDKVHRQGEGSSIVSLAHDINKQIISKDLLIKQKDRNFIICSNDTLLKNLKFIMENALDKAYTLEEIQVLAPMYKGNLGIDNINSYLQEWLNPKSGDIKEFKYLNKVFRTGDKVIQLVNRPDLNIMNGDIGFIKDIYDEESRDDDVRLTVDFDGNIVDLTENDLNDLSLAYCISIHKAQGSEFDIVIVLLSKSYYIMLRKNLLYTAVTRAKKSLILLGDPDAYKLAIQNDQEIMRQTTLIERLQMRFNRRIITIDDYKFIYKPIKKLSPYDFLE